MITNQKYTTVSQLSLIFIMKYQFSYNIKMHAKYCENLNNAKKKVVFFYMRKKDT